VEGGVGHGGSGVSIGGYGIGGRREREVGVWVRRAGFVGRGRVQGMRRSRRERTLGSGDGGSGALADGRFLSPK
jgi:hypothetical protein